MQISPSLEAVPRGNAHSAESRCEEWRRGQNYHQERGCGILWRLLVQRYEAAETLFYNHYEVIRTLTMGGEGVFVC